jgi:phosphatidylserine/phosphatidylglycerophosphate/cardiolipin synthase-like enzyme
MRASASQDNLTLRVIAGTTNVILGMDLQESHREGCLGFSIERTDLGTQDTPIPPGEQKPRWLPNMLRFPSDPDSEKITTERAPLQKFRWGDYTTRPGRRYRYRVVARYGSPGKLTPALTADAGVAVEVTTEDNRSPGTAVFFNRGAAASEAFLREFPNVTSEELLLGESAPAKAARVWLSRGLEEALLAYLAKATDASFVLHAAIYEFQKPSLLAGLRAALEERGVDVQVVYHHRQKSRGGKPDPKDKTAGENDGAIKAAGLTAICTPRQADPQGAIMHDKFVVLLKKNGEGELEPQAVWTGSTNWTDGGIYGQLNVGHAIYEPEIAALYEQCFQLLRSDPSAADLKKALGKLTPVPKELPAEHRTRVIFSPQSNLGMIDLYASFCSNARCLMVCAPFELHETIRTAFEGKSAGTLHYLLLDQKKALGKPEEVEVQEADPRNTIAVATTLPSALHDFQGELLEGKESFLHSGIHIHSKIILADPFGSDPILATGSANYSTNSTTSNDSNTLVIRGNLPVTDIYVTEFMRMFEHYHFRAAVAKAEKEQGKKAEPLALKETDEWSLPYYVPGSNDELDRRMFAGTLA